MDASCVTTPGASFEHELTLHLYPVVDGEVGDELVSIPAYFDIPFRPSADPSACSGGNGWFDETAGKCANGKAFTVTFETPDAIHLPDDVLVTLSFETSRDGLPDGPYDSLNLLTPSLRVTVGTVVDTDDTWSVVGDGALARGTGETSYQPAFSLQRHDVGRARARHPRRPGDRPRGRRRACLHRRDRQRLPRTAR